MKLYLEAARILREALDKKSTVKSLIFASDYANTKQLYGLVYESLKYTAVLRNVIGGTSLLEDKDFKDNMALVQVLLYEILLGNGVSRRSRYKKVMRKHLDVIYAYCDKLMEQSGVNTMQELLPISGQDVSVVPLPRYARVNTLKTKLKYVAKKLKRGGYVRHHRKGLDYNRFLEIIRNMNKDEFIRDIQVNSLLVLSPGLDFHEHPLYQSGEIILQDKASCFPPLILAPPPGSQVIDCCAAPGNKASHLASLMDNEGKIFAFDMDEKRLNFMKNMMDKTGVKCVECIHQDFLQTVPQDPKYKDVEYILIDPSCSGSGIATRLNNPIDSISPSSSERLEKLANFQVMLLKHALLFPQIQRAVYSTCSVYAEENEAVVEEVYTHVKDTFYLKKIFPEYTGRGKKGFLHTQCYLRWSPKRDLTNGFFTACFERRNGSGTEEALAKTSCSQKKRMIEY